LQKSRDIFVLIYSLEQSSATELLELLGYLPLAIKQAGSYVSVRQLSLDQYLNRYKRNRTSLLAHYESKAVWDDRKYVTVFTTSEISFSAIEEESPDAAYLLQILAFLDREDIQGNMLRHGYGLPEGGKFALFSISY
jgi:hypothetical protein